MVEAYVVARLAACDWLSLLTLAKVLVGLCRVFSALQADLEEREVKHIGMRGCTPVSCGSSRHCPEAGTGAKSLHPASVLPQPGGGGKMASQEHHCCHVPHALPSERRVLWKVTWPSGSVCVLTLAPPHRLASSSLSRFTPHLSIHPAPEPSAQTLPPLLLTLGKLWRWKEI